MEIAAIVFLCLLVVDPTDVVGGFELQEIPELNYDRHPSKRVANLRIVAFVRIVRA